MDKPSPAVVCGVAKMLWNLRRMRYYAPLSVVHTVAGAYNEAPLRRTEDVRETSPPFTLNCFNCVNNRVRSLPYLLIVMVI